VLGGSARPAPPGAEGPAEQPPPPGQAGADAVQRLRQVGIRGESSHRGQPCVSEQVRVIEHGGRIAHYQVSRLD
jgi:hypothetical protein